MISFKSRYYPSRCLFFVYCGAMVDIYIEMPTRFRLIPHRQFLSLFINNKLGIFAVFLVGANEDKIHIGDDAEATVAAKFTF